MNSPPLLYGNSRTKMNRPYRSMLPSAAAHSASRCVPLSLCPGQTGTQTIRNLPVSLLKNRTDRLIPDNPVSLLKQMRNRNVYYFESFVRIGTGLYSIPGTTLENTFPRES